VHNEIVCNLVYSQRQKSVTLKFMFKIITNLEMVEYNGIIEILNSAYGLI